MQSAPLPEDEPSRLAELYEYKILDTPPEEGFDNLAKLAAQICGTPIALVSLVDAERQWFKAKVGINASETPRDIAFCAHTIHDSDVFVVPDATQDERFADNPLVATDPNIRFYAGMPLVTAAGHAMGTLCVIDRVPKQLTDDQMDALRILGRQVVSRLELKRHQIGLERSLARNEQANRTNSDIIRAIERGLEGVAFLDKDGCFTYMNPAHAAFYGYKPDELLGRSWTTLYAPETSTQIEQYYFPILLRLGHWSGEVTGRTKSGQEVFAEISLVLSEGGQNSDRWLICTCRDVTKYKVVKNQLETNQESLAKAQALAHVGSWEWDIETGAEIWSDEHFRIFGYAPHAITPTIETFREAIHPDDQARVFQAVETALQQDQPYQENIRIFRPSGELRYIQARGTVTRNAEGHPTRMTGTVQDITEQQAYEQILSDTIQRLDLATKSGNIGVWDYYIPENKLVWDRRMYELYGYTAEDFPGAYQAWTDRLHPEDCPHADALLQAAIAGKGEFNTEFRLVLPDQTLRHIKATATVLRNEQGHPVRMIGTNRDITARKESELALLKLQGFQEAILLNAPHAIIATTVTGIIQHFNPAAEQLLGYSSEEMIGKLTPAVFHCAEEVAARAKIFGTELGVALEPGFEVFVAKARRNLPNQHEWIYIRKDGTRIPVLLSVTAIRDHTGIITGFLGMATDISAQKKTERSRLAAEAALREKEELTRVMIEHVTDYAIIRLDPEGRVVSWNQGAQRLKGYSADEIIGRHFSCFYTEESLASGEPAALLTRATSHRHAEAEGWRRRKGGSRFLANIVITAIFDQDDRLKGFTKVVRDITERKQAEEQFRQVVEAAPNGILVANEEGVITLVNAQVEQWFGYDRQELIGQKIEILLPERYRAAHPGQRTGFFQNPQARAMGMGRDLFGRRKDGTEFPLEIGLSPIQTPHGTQVLAAIVDITARKQAEEQFRLIVEAAPNGMLVVNQEGIITLTNPQVERWFGYDRQELIGQKIEILLPERYQSSHGRERRAFSHSPQSRPMGMGRELFGRRKDGSEFQLEIGLSPIKTSQGIFVLAAMTDISDRKQAENQLKETAQELASKNIKLAEANHSALKATRAKSEFMATMSHEIRTPMNAIVAMADLLQATPLSKEQQEYVGRYSRAATSLLDLINDILDISKIEAGQLELESVAFDLHDLVDKIGELMAIRAHAKRLEITTFVHPDIPTWVSGDPIRLRQVLVNLLGNAIKFTERGEVVLRVEPSQLDSGTLRCSVSDTGIGIPADKVESIFESFTQVDSSTTRKYGGTGLGLSICKRLVGLMGGHIEVDSTEGLGSTFSFVVHLPKVPVPPTASPLPTPDLRNRRLLIVDDTETNRMVVREHLKQFGPVLVEVPDGPAALRALDNAQQEGKPFDLAIVDYYMPNMDGLDLAEALRKRKDCASLPLIMYASDLRGHAAERARKLGIVGYAYKPVSRKRLLESLAVALNQTSAIPAQQPAATHPESVLPLSCHILLVEDLEDNRDVIRLFLKETPYQLDMAENGAEALQKFKGSLYDLVLMDMQMPVMDGLEATAAIRRWEQEQQRRPTPIVALTANAFKEEAEKSLAAGCTAHVTKPIKKKTLLSTITQYAGASKDQAA